MKKYNNYKNSGVEWLGEIPEHWEILPGLSFIYENKDRNKGMVRNTVLSLSYGNIRVKGENELTGLVPESFETYQFVNKGDLIFRPTDLQNDTVSLRSSISEYDGIITNAYLNLRFKSKADSKFYHYFFRSIDNNKIIYGLGSGLRQNISYLDFRRFSFPFPPLEEQTAIAHFLDDKTTKIDQAIAIKQQQIELLKERRQILIHKAVTRGLNDTVKFKDSGVEWIGEIPEGWEVKKIKHIFEQIKTGTTPSTSNPKFYDGEIDWYNPKDLNNESLNYSEKKISKLAINRKEISLFPSDSILIVGIGGTTGKTSYLINTGTFNQQITGFHSHKQYNKYYFYLFHSLSKVMLNTASYTTLPILNNEFFKSFRLIKPKIEEQKEIVEYIETATTKIATAISLKEQEIEKLKEYKMSLIDGVVSGKVKVC
ncbi:putative type I restriction-modification system, DNA specificity domain protein [Flavobacterium branchiophilum]|uniref:Probable type I restriction-modification system, DNA specificity domain protein n=1 Tax=Flavobacterium branchiophilum (strain FL-15) TaxID=1034807 RepID=G2Z1R9_FLABF|nr:restriction endonuclease subunit S [Flavobacterium branchiophilum]CCB69854.1 Probable type I restriction-modification system, DNA specificity domain protein [Flavobacterium branchiophilum FL-15]